jgi:hypothetical protein
MRTSLVSTQRLSGRCLALVLAFAGASATAQQEETLQPQLNQPGSTSVVPTPPARVEKMLDLAAVTPKTWSIPGPATVYSVQARRGARARHRDDARLVSMSSARKRLVLARTRSARRHLQDRLTPPSSRRSSCRR